MKQQEMEQKVVDHEEKQQVDPIYGQSDGLIVYKLTDQDGYTRRGMTGQTPWYPGIRNVKYSFPDDPRLCTSDVYHAYGDINLAIVCNCIHADIKKFRLWECKTDKIVCSDDTKVGVFDLEVVRELGIPSWYLYDLDKFLLKFLSLMVKEIYSKKMDETRDSDAINERFTILGPINDMHILLERMFDTCMRNGDNFFNNTDFDDGIATILEEIGDQKVYDVHDHLYYVLTHRQHLQAYLDMYQSLLSDHYGHMGLYEMVDKIINILRPKPETK